MPDLANTTGALTTRLKGHAKLLGGFVGLLWVIQVVNYVLGGLPAAIFGIHPRSIFGLIGIPFAPLLHANFAHLIANTSALLVLGWFVMLRRTRDWWVVNVLAALVGGVGTWMFGGWDSVHVGASVLIFGYLGHLLSRGVFERKFWPILGSVAVFLLYGGALFGVLPGHEGISWQMHLFGFLGGVLAARMLRDSNAPSPALGVATTGKRIAAPRVRVPGLAEEPGEEESVEDELARLRQSVRR